MPKRISKKRFKEPQTVGELLVKMSEFVTKLLERDVQAEQAEWQRIKERDNVSEPVQGVPLE